MGKTPNGINGNGVTNGKNGHAHNGFHKLPSVEDQLLTQHQKKITGDEAHYEEIPLHVSLLTFISYGLLVLVGYIKEFFGQLFGANVIPQEKGRSGYAPLFASFESFYTRNVFRRIRDCWNRPICSVPGAYVTLMDRISHDHGWTFEFTGTCTKCLNFGSYNYLGFAESKGSCADDSEEAINNLGIAVGSSRHEIGTTKIQVDLESLVARFLGTEDAVVFGMGFATNALNLPCLVKKGDLVFSDENNHASLILGLRLSGATIKVFKHNDMKDLDRKLKQAVVYGQPRTRRPWKKMLIVVEGIYSMEGSIVKLPDIIALKKKYKAYLYLDEAHSIGAVGPRGRGVVDHFGCNPKDVDILMGTFTKSFGSAGGYIAGNKRIIDYIRCTSHAACYATAMSPPVAQQIISSMKIIMGDGGTDEGQRRLKRIAQNARYFRQKLMQKGFIVYGSDASPVIPVLLYMPGKIAAIVRELTVRGVSTVGVGFPATRITEGRARFCMSASHTREMLDRALDAIDEVGDLIAIKYSRMPRSIKPVTYDDTIEISSDVPEEINKVD